MQDVPVAVTALSGDTLASRRIDNAKGLRFVAPALQVSPSSFGKAVPGYTIRSQRSLESLITQDPAVGIYFAEQVQQRPHGTNSSFYDLASVEVLKGPQGTLFGRKLTINAAAYNQWYKDIQRTLSFGVPLRSLVINAGGAKIRGGEVEVSTSPVSWLDLAATVAYSDAYYTDFSRAELGDLKANEFAMAPKTTYTLSGTVHLPIPDSAGELDLGANYYHQSQIFVSDLNQGNSADFPITGYGILNLSMDWRNVGGMPIDPGAYVKNVTRKKYYTGGATVYPSTGMAGYIIGEPHIWGVSLTYRFGAMASR